MFKQFTVILLLAATFSACSSDNGMDAQTGDVSYVSQAAVNAIIGDVSYVARFGVPPGPDTDEDLRIRTHLKYVEKLLRARPVEQLSTEQKSARAQHLDRLREYVDRGVFPRNRDYPGERRPTFIDDDGRICAVGYLVEQSAGRDAADQINAAYRNAYIAKMEMPMLDDWIADSGLSREELGMIQPTYCGEACQKARDKMAPGNEVGVAALNAVAAAVNGYTAVRGQPSYVISGAGLVFGATGLAMGLSERANYGTTDIVFAGASLMLATWNLGTLLHARHNSARSSKLLPEARMTIVPARGQLPRPGLSLMWTP